MCVLHAEASNLGLGSSAPRLGLNCVGGSAALCAAKVMADSGTLVTYVSLGPLGVLPTKPDAATAAAAAASFDCMAVAV